MSGRDRYGAAALYGEIKGLIKDISSGETKVTKRRATGARILEILSTEKNRNKLSELGISNAMARGFSHAKAKRYAMTVLWTPVIQGALNSAEKLVTGKCKLTADDVKLPLRLLHYSDKSAEGNRVKLESTCKLPQKMVKRILKFCKEMLENDEARALAEMEILNTLIFVCERVDYVAYLGTEDILDMLSTSEGGLFREEVAISTASARIFGAVLESCRELGIGLHIFMSMGFRMVAKWCRANLDTASSSRREQPYLFRGLTALLRAHPEQAITGITKFGRWTLNYANRSYQNANHTNRHIIHGYLIAHIIVCQESGRMRGLLAGDLGPGVSLGREQLESLIPVVIASLSKVDLSITTKKRVRWDGLRPVVQRHLELCARLLACAQRCFLREEEWGLLDDPNDFFTRAVKAISRENDEVIPLPQDQQYPVCPPKLLQKSPWIRFMLQPLIETLPNLALDETIMDTSSGFLEPNSQVSERGYTESNNGHSFAHPLLDNIQKSAQQANMDSKLLAPLLMVISATAEAFPSGKCWASSSHKFWKTVAPGDSTRDDAMHVHGCSPDDFALLVFAVAKLLDASGGPTGDPEIQILCLLCLIRLTDAHSVVVTCLRDRDLSNVETAWRLVWSAIFRRDLRYASYTANVISGSSCGELVLILLTEMVQQWCTDPSMLFSASASQQQSSFLYRNQHQIWLLPAFSKNKSHQSKQLFELIATFLHRVSLSDEGEDNIQDTFPLLQSDCAIDNENQRALGRRYRLVCLCLQRLASIPVESVLKEQEMMEVVSACLSSLVSCKVSLTSRSFFEDSQNLTWARSSVMEGARNKLCFTELPDTTVFTVKRKSTDSSKSALFEILWGASIADPGMNSLQQSKLMIEMASDVVLAEKSKLCHVVRTLALSSDHVDYTPSTTSNQLAKLLRPQMKNLLGHWIAATVGEESMECDSKNMDLEIRPVALPLRCIWLKTALSTCVLCREEEFPTPSLGFLREEIVSVLQKLSTDLPELCDDAKAFSSVFSSLLQTFRFLNDMALEVRSLQFPSELMQHFASLVALCESLLTSFSGADQGDQTTWDDNLNGREENSSESDGCQEDTMMADILSDSDDDEAVNRRAIARKKAAEKKQKQPNKKRTNSNQEASRTPRKKSRHHPSPPNFSCAGLVGSFLVLLDPCHARCAFVVESLVRRGDSNSGEVDLALTYHCLGLISDESVIFHDNAKGELVAASNPLDESFRHESPFTIIGELLESLLNSCLPASSLYLYRFGLCGDCVRMGEHEFRGMPLTAEESKSLVDLICIDEDAINERPYLRLDQLRAATTAFELGADNFHKFIDTIFPKQFVLSPLTAPSLLVRKDASFAAGAALRILSNKEKIVKAIFARLPPVVMSTNDSTKYQDWYENIELASGNLKLENKFWEDSLLSMEYGALYCRAVIGGLDLEFAEDILYELIWIAHNRSDLQAACFCVCEKIAFMQGYNEMELFLADQSEAMLKRWIKDGRTFSQIPLLLSSPRLLRLLLETGQQTRLYTRPKPETDSADVDVSKFLEVENLQDVAVDSFIGRCRRFLLPQMLVRMLNAVEGGLSTAILQDQYIQEFCVCLRGDHKASTIKQVVASRLHDIEALCAPMVQSNLSAVGTQILKLVTDLLEETQGTGSNKGKPHLIVRRILELSGKNKPQIFPCHIIQEAFAEAITSLVDKQKSKKKGDILSAAGLSVTECFLYARRWLDNATTVVQKEMRWQSISLLFDLIFAHMQRNDYEQTQLGFGLVIVVDIALAERGLRSQALALMKRALDQIVTAATPLLIEELALVFRRLVGALMKMQEDSQQELVRRCRRKAATKLRVFEKSLGFLANHIDSNDIAIGVSDVWGWNEAAVSVARRRTSDEIFFKEVIQKSICETTKSAVDSITGTYDLLVEIFDKALTGTLPFGIDYYVGCMPPYAVSDSTQETLRLVNPRFCAQLVSKHFLEQFRGSQKDDITASVTSLLDKLKNRVSWMDSIQENRSRSRFFDSAQSNEDGYSLTLSQWMLKAELVHLECLLRQRRTEKEQELALSDESLVLLINELSYVCGASCPAVLSASASRCLGELDIRFISISSAGRQQEDWIERALESECLLRGIQADAILILSEYLYSQHSNVAIAAMDTLIALLATREGAECWDLLEVQVQQNLQPFLTSKKRSATASTMQLPKSHFTSIKSVLGIDATTQATRDWCWNPKLWHCRSDAKGAYDKYICALVPSLIECCFRVETAVKKGGDFFSACQVMCAIAPGFATSVFPATILGILEAHDNTLVSPTDAPSISVVLEDTWIGNPDSKLYSKLSSSFEVLLGQTETQNARTIGLAIDTLNLLRRSTQSRFMHSEGHKRNSNAVGDQSTGQDKKHNKSSRGSKSTPKNTNNDTGDSYNKGLEEVVSWKGLPFGTVLKLDGDLVVRACIKINRWASALFYADLYFEAAFGGSGAIMELLANDFAAASSRALLSSKTDISGSFNGAEACETTMVRYRAVASLQLLGDCYLELHEEDAYQAVQRQSSDLRYSSCDCIATESEELTRVLVPTLADLQRLDSLSNSAVHSVEVSLQASDTMEALGLRSFLQSYVSSMEWSKIESFSTDEKRKLREKWFESRLFGMAWDKALLDCAEKVSPTGETLLQKTVVLGEGEIPADEMGVHEGIYRALGAFARDDFRASQGFCEIARASLHHAVSTMATGESSIEELKMLIERLQSLNDIDHLANPSESPDRLLTFWGFKLVPTEKMQLKESFPSAGFLPCMQETMLRLLRSKTRADNMEAADPQQLLTEHLWSFAAWCRETNHLQMADTCLQRLRATLRVVNNGSPASLDTILGLRLQEASLKEVRGDFATAVRLSKHTISLLQQEKTQRRGENFSDIECLLVDSMVNCGSWLSKHKIEPARVILDSYHKPSAILASRLYQRSNNPENARRFVQAQIALAGLASRLFDTVSARVKSLEWLKSGRSLSEREQELKNCDMLVKEAKVNHAKAQKAKTPKIQLAKIVAEHMDLISYSRNLQNEIELSKRERIKTVKALKEHLCLAMRSYASALSVVGAGHESDMSRHVFRMAYLWFSSCTEGKEDKDVNEIMDSAIAEIPSFRFVPLTPQLFAQIDEIGSSAFQKTLQNLVLKMCAEHPYHTLVQLISVCNGKEVGSGVSGRNASNYLENMSSSKVDAALKLAKKLSNSAPKYVVELLDSYQTLMNAYIALANAPTAELVQTGKTKKISLAHASKNQRLDRCLGRRAECPPCVLTKPPPLRSGADYRDGMDDPIGGERVEGFESHFDITDSGLHRPKIVMCRGTKGGRFRQLVKGEDEIRQDAVMEQVFMYVNELMRRPNGRSSTESSHDRSIARSSCQQQELRMVTYNIIPLSPASGVLEWVEDSMTFGDYVLDTKSSNGYKIGSHSRYYPGEWGHLRCRHHFVHAPEDFKRDSFDVVCKNFSPSFRFFFVERFGHSLKDWYAAKMKYTRSVAVSSIVGHILGIGDRHTNNILISQITGEVVHIDFGIVFEQGKLLAVPELVPFRLTRNIVDGLGPTGTEGTFARAAEATAAELRENSNALLTILSAVASDPLYRFTVSPVEARRRQRLIDDDQASVTTPAEKTKDGELLLAAVESKSERNEAAAMVLAKIQEKLQGYEDGTSGEQQSIEGQVQLLINSARDPNNLSAMFGGWASWV